MSVLTREHGLGVGLVPAPLRAFAWTIAISAAATGLYFVPGASDLLAYDRAALAAGELWRLLTGHIVHWSTGHLFWSVSVFAVLGAALEARGRKRFLVCTLASALAISLIEWGFSPELMLYGGLSGIDSALFALLGADFAREEWKAGRRASLWLVLALALAFAGKLVFEAVTGSAIFVSELPPGFAPVPAAHLVGAAIGIACSLIAMPDLEDEVSDADEL